jgi:hypothetical protein
VGETQSYHFQFSFSPSVKILYKGLQVTFGWLSDSDVGVE